MLEFNTVICADCCRGMQDIPDNSFDIALVDPPYNLSKGGNWSWNNDVKLKGFGGAWTKVMQTWDDMPLSDYIEFCLVWLAQLKRIIKPTGSFWIHGTYHNIGLINFCLQILEIEIINEVIWYKRNSFPNLSGRRLTASHETILWAHTGSEKKRLYNFNYDNSKHNSYPEDKLKAKGKQMRTVWDIPNNKSRDELKYGKHPTQKPIRLLKRMLDVSAPNDAKILIPFVGSGSECVAALEMGYDFLGYEIEKEYIDIANSRINCFEKKLTLF
jgi:site-specific DNA-methyltransferase (adenine-specific)